LSFSFVVDDRRTLLCSHSVPSSPPCPCERWLERTAKAAEKEVPSVTRAYRLVPVGYIRSPIKNREDAPRQGRDVGVEVSVDVLPDYRSALEGLERWPQIQVVCWMHLAPRDVLQVVPKGDPSLPLTGVFATRSPTRPNPFAIYTVDLLEVSCTGLQVRGVDAVDGTPVVDIRPHIHRLDD
jgi:L-fuculose-phosphate aldolase